MDKYEGIYKVDTRLTDNSERAYSGRGKGEFEPAKEADSKAAHYERRYTDVEPYEKGCGRMASCKEYDRYATEHKESLYRIKKSCYDYDDEVIVYKSVKRSEKGRFNGILIRLLVSAAIFFTIFGMSKMDVPFCQRITESIKQAITYDLDNKKNKDLGEINAVMLIIEEQEKQIQAKQEELE